MRWPLQHERVDPMPWRARFLAPRYALSTDAGLSRFTVGRATAADARVAIFIAPAVSAADGLVARFAVHGPPVLVACADWVCEHLGTMGLDTARCPSVSAFENALALAPEDRFAVIAVQDAVTDALELIARQSYDHDSD